MGTLTAMAYPTVIMAKAADHTYVQCCAEKAWGCWGGKTGGHVVRSGTGSTRRADAIAGANEKAGIKCYLVNGVCHQAANRILLPAGITVAGARGYSVSEAMFGTYGRVGFWPCKSPFNQHADVTGDLPCAAKGSLREPLLVSRNSMEAKGEWQYISGVLAIYGGAKKLMSARTLDQPAVESVHLALFRHMAAFQLGERLDKGLEKKLLAVRKRTEKLQTKAEKGFATAEIDALELARQVDAAAIALQDEMAETLDKDSYRLLFDLEKGERVRLADPTIAKETYGIEIPEKW